MINFYCRCGQLMSVRPEFVGRTGQCPRCGSPVTVPTQSQTSPTAPTILPPSPGGATHPYDRNRLGPPPTTGAPPPPPPPPPARTGSGGGSGRGGATRPASLEVVHGPAAVLGKVYPVPPGRPAVIGRDPGVEVSVASERVSRRHCQLIQRADGAWVVQDLGSSNGTLVNQARINGPQAVASGDYIQAGDCLFRFAE